MSDALREQLLKAGLADEKSVKKASRDARKGRNRRGNRQDNAVAATTDEAREATRAARKARQERDRELNRAREAEQEARAARAQVDDLLRRQALPTRNGEVPYHFTHGTVIRRIHVTPEQQTGLSKGRLAVVQHRGHYHLVPAETAEAILARAPETFVCRVEDGGDEGEAYAEHPIPDDLQW